MIDIEPRRVTHAEELKVGESFDWRQTNGVLMGKVTILEPPRPTILGRRVMARVAYTGYNGKPRSYDTPLLLPNFGIVHGSERRARYPSFLEYPRRN